MSQWYGWLFADQGKFYGPMSSWVGDLAMLSIFGTLYRKHICHTKGCWRLGRHPDGLLVVCAKHHPDL